MVFSNVIYRAANEPSAVFTITVLLVFKAANNTLIFKTLCYRVGNPWKVDEKMGK